MNSANSSCDNWERTIEELALLEYLELVDWEAYFKSVDGLLLEPDGFIDKHPHMETQ